MGIIGDFTKISCTYLYSWGHTLGTIECTYTLVRDVVNSFSEPEAIESLELRRGRFLVVFRGVRLAL